MSKETNRRDFIGYSFAAVAAVGGAASLVGMKKRGIHFKRFSWWIY